MSRSALVKPPIRLRNNQTDKCVLILINPMTNA